MMYNEKQTGDNHNMYMFFLVKDISRKPFTTVGSVKLNDLLKTIKLNHETHSPMGLIIYPSSVQVSWGV